MKVTVFVPRSECAACRCTKLGFDRAGIDYEVVESGDDVIAGLKSDGFSEFPVVKVDCGGGASWCWSGFRLDEIRRLALLGE